MELFCGDARLKLYCKGEGMENWSDDAFDKAYDERKADELEALRKRRIERARHRRVIARCNLLLVCEGITLVILIVALILNW